MFEDNLSAQVILRPLGAGGELPTAETVARLLPSPDSVELARSFFRSRGFEVSPAFGNSFSITGPASTYEGTFGRRVQEEPGRVAVDGLEGAAELPLDQLPAEVASAVQAVVFPPPPDFGPNSY